MRVRAAKPAPELSGGPLPRAGLSQLKEFWKGICESLQPWARIHLLTPSLLSEMPGRDEAMNKCMKNLRVRALNPAWRKPLPAGAPRPAPGAVRIARRR